jgi:2-keto-4-pentenoate hydratase/2-oxohepta-3-ene-1,7-dioic acid hydratase in catechol pathway
MRIASYHHDGTEGYGLVVDDGVIDLAGRLGHPTLLAALRHGTLADAARFAGQAADRPLSAVALLPPVTAPEKIWCIGVNYAERNDEYRDNSSLPQYPSLFCRSASSLVGHGAPLERPSVSEQLDYEGEIVLVIGRAGRHIPQERAWEHIAGLTIGNEGTVRDWLRHGKFNVTQGKNFDRSGSVGPWMVTADAFDPTVPMLLTTRVNGEMRQQDSTARLMFSFANLLAYLSTFATLRPGDTIFTGTPTGAGARFDPPRWLKPGDTVEVEVDGIGILSNPVIDEVGTGGAA